MRAPCLLYIINVERFIFFMCFYAYSLLFHKEYAKKRNQGVPPWYPNFQLRAFKARRGDLVLIIITPEGQTTTFGLRVFVELFVWLQTDV